MTNDSPDSLICDDGSVDVRAAPRIEVNDAACRRDIRHADSITDILVVSGVQCGQPNGDRRRFGELDVECDLNAFFAGGRLLRCPRPHWTGGHVAGLTESDIPGGNRDSWKAEVYSSSERQFRRTRPPA